MPIIIDPSLPAVSRLLEQENIRVTGKSPERPLRIGIVNLMPLKEMTEYDLLRHLSATPLPVELHLITMASHMSRNTPREHIEAFYRTWDGVRGLEFDGMIFTGAPVENLAFEDVDYWNELTEMMDWARKNVRSTLYICWGAFAGLYHHHGIDKIMLSDKLSGVYRHTAEPGAKHEPLLRGMDDEFFVPHSRFAAVSMDDVRSAADLRVIATSAEAGLYIAEAAGTRDFYITGHSEYAPDTLDFEYRRDVAKGMSPHVPANYYRNDNPDEGPVVRWRSHAALLFSNWLHFYVNPEY